MRHREKSQRQRVCEREKARDCVRGKEEEGGTGWIRRFNPFWTTYGITRKSELNLYIVLAPANLFYIRQCRYIYTQLLSTC